jgi:tRNA(fMet)-specific endonuclease VapC
MNGPSLFDTDMVSRITHPLSGTNRPFTLRVSDYRERYGRFGISVLTRYEVRRGLWVKRATVRLNRFDWFCEQFVESFPLTDSILEIATRLWSEARLGGHSAGEIDLLIAATALDLGRPLVTGNAKHYEWMPGLALENWQ